MLKVTQPASHKPVVATDDPPAPAEGFLPSQSRLTRHGGRRTLEELSAGTADAKRLLPPPCRCRSVDAMHLWCPPSRFCSWLPAKISRRRGREWPCPQTSSGRKRSPDGEAQRPGSERRPGWPTRTSSERAGPLPTGWHTGGNRGWRPLGRGAKIAASTRKSTPEQFHAIQRGQSDLFRPGRRPTRFVGEHPPSAAHPATGGAGTDSG